MSKSLLYELIQKNSHISRPEFSYTDTFNRLSNTHIYRCHASININGMIKGYISDEFTNKKDSNQDVCLKIYSDLTKSTDIDTQHPQYPQIQTDKIIWILIDYENISNPKEIIKLEQYLCTQPFQSNIIKFASHASTVRDTADIVIKSTRKDAVDHYIGYWIGLKLGQNESIKNSHLIYILSRDHFASCLEDFIDIVKHEISVNDLIDSIYNLSLKS